MKIKHFARKDLVEFEGNPRKKSEKVLSALVKSIVANGFIQPLVRRIYENLDKSDTSDWSDFRHDLLRCQEWQRQQSWHGGATLADRGLRRLSGGRW
jgi:hypothetical protein